jgi:hypothetical protein
MVSSGVGRFLAGIFTTVEQNHRSPAALREAALPSRYVVAFRAT